MKNKFKEQHKEVKNLIDQSDNIIIIPHYNPDGDAIGSALAWSNYLTEMNKNARVMVPNLYPEFLKWLPGTNDVLTFEEQRAFCRQELIKADLIIFNDFNCLDRMGPLATEVQNLNCPKILVDHHPYPENFADIIISDTTVSSTAELVYNVLQLALDKAAISKNTATCLMTGILTDTGTFSFNSSNPATFKTVSELLNIGVDKDQIVSNIYDNYSENRMKLLGYCLHNKMVVIEEYRTAYISISKDELERFNFQPGDTEGFVNYPLSVKGIVFSALFIEKEDFIKISFRSKGSFAANQFSANHFNGGGHLNAAGGNASLTMLETLEKFHSLLPDYSEEIRNSMQ